MQGAHCGLKNHIDGHARKGGRRTGEIYPSGMDMHKKHGEGSTSRQKREGFHNKKKKSS